MAKQGTWSSLIQNDLDNSSFHQNEREMMENVKLGPTFALHTEQRR